MAKREQTTSYVIFGVLAIIFVLVSWFICSAFFPKTTVLENIRNLSMKAWILEERGVIVKSDNPKIKRVYKFMVVSTRELKRESEDDALWETKEGVYFRLTDKKPQGLAIPL